MAEKFCLKMAKNNTISLLIFHEVVSQRQTLHYARTFALQRLAVLNLHNAN
jgi:hypothetical protein